MWCHTAKKRINTFAPSINRIARLLFILFTCAGVAVAQDVDQKIREFTDQEFTSCPDSKLGTVYESVHTWPCAGLARSAECGIIYKLHVIGAKPFEKTSFGSGRKFMVTVTYDRLESRSEDVDVWTGWVEWRDQISTYPVAVVDQQDGNWLGQNTWYDEVGSIVDGRISGTPVFPGKDPVKQQMEESLNSPEKPWDVMMSGISHRPCDFFEDPSGKVKVLQQANAVNAVLNSIQHFTGTPDQLEMAFPNYLADAAKARNLDPHDYEREEAFILNVVRTCSGITSEMALRVTEKNAAGYPVERIDKLGAQYQVCDGRVPQDASANQSSAGLRYRVMGRWGDRRQFTLQVYIMPPKDSKFYFPTPNPFLSATINLP